MPELPEAERARLQIDRVLGREIVAVDDRDTYVCRPHAPGEIAAALIGRRLAVGAPAREVPLGRRRTTAARSSACTSGWRADRRRRGARAAQLGPLRARVRRRRPAGAARQAPARPGGARAGLLARRPGRGRGRPRAFRARVGRGGAPLKARLLDQGVDLRRRQPAGRRDRSGAPGSHPRRPAGEPRPEELDALRRALRAAIRSRDPPAAASTPAPSSRTATAEGHCPRCGTAARARHHRRAHHVLVPGLPAGLTGRRSALGRRRRPGRARARRRRPRGGSAPCRARRSTAVERIWPTITVTDMLPVCSSTSVARPAARSAGSRTASAAASSASPSTASSARTARARSRTASPTSGGTLLVEVDRAAGAAREHAHVADREVDLGAGRRRSPRPCRAYRRRGGASGRLAARRRAPPRSRARAPRSRGRARARPGRSRSRCASARATSSSDARRARRARDGRRAGPCRPGCAGKTSALTASATLPPISASSERANVIPPVGRLQRRHERRRDGGLLGEHLAGAEQQRDRHRERRPRPRAATRPCRRRARAGRRRRSRA